MSFSSNGRIFFVKRQPHLFIPPRFPAQKNTARDKKVSWVGHPKKVNIFLLLPTPSPPYLLTFCPVVHLTQIWNRKNIPICEGKFSGFPKNQKHKMARENLHQREKEQDFFDPKKRGKSTCVFCPIVPGFYSPTRTIVDGGCNKSEAWPAPRNTTTIQPPLNKMPISPQKTSEN